MNSSANPVKNNVRNPGTSTIPSQLYFIDNLIREQITPLKL